jgi:hypothetical protein
MSVFQINGIGIRDFHKTISTGTFECSNDHCKGKRGGGSSQQYKLISTKRWFTLFWIPLIPLGGRAVYVECKSCKAHYSPSAVPGASV